MLQLIQKRIRKNEFVKVVGTTHYVDKGRSFLLQNRVDVLLLDLSLKGGSGLDLLNIVSQFDTKTWVVVITVFSEFRNYCLNNGADFFIDKTEEINKLNDILSEIVSAEADNN